MPGKGSIYLGQSLSFKLPVFVGDEVTAEVEVIAMRDDKPIATLATRIFTQGGALAVSTTIGNLLGGHAIPTGEPMRALLLVVHAEACGKVLAPSGGMTLDDWGGALAEGMDRSLFGSRAALPRAPAPRRR